MAKTEFNSIIQLIEKFSDEQTCIDHLKELRWKDGQYCPHCGNEKIYEFKDGKTFKCAACRKKFTVKVGTIFEDSPLPLQKWFVAIYLVTSHKKGISSIQLAKDINVTQKTAWLLCHKIREIWTVPSRQFTGQVEADETYLGGKEKNKHESRKLHAGRGIVGKQAVLGARERTGKVMAITSASTEQEAIHGFIEKNVSPGTTVFTDDHRSYLGLKGYNHESLNHSAGEYVRGKVHTNGIESFWALLKRGYYGTFHHLSMKHADRYINEFSTRNNNRECDTIDVMAITAKGVTGKLLPYKELVYDGTQS